jgi:PAS domain-containing protein
MESRLTSRRGKRAEQTLWENRNLLRSVLTTLPVGVVVDRAGDILLVNAVSKRIWGEIIVLDRKLLAQSLGYRQESDKRIEPETWVSERAVRDGQTSLNELNDIETSGAEE